MAPPEFGGPGGDGKKPGDSAGFDLEPEAQDDPQGEGGGDRDGDDEVWFEADELERASAVEVGISGHALRARAADDLLEHMREQPCLSLSVLPGWPGGPETGAGWGPLTQHVGTVRPGWLGIVSAGRGGSGRSAFVQQLADGLARLVPSGGAPVVACPVAILSEDGEAEVRARSLARWTGQDARIFREGRAGAMARGLWSVDQVESAWLEAKAASSGALMRLFERQRFFHLDGREPGIEMLEEMCHELATWKVQLASDEGLELDRVWPVVVVDTLEGWSPPGSAVDALAPLANLCRREGWVTLVATGAPELRAGQGDRLCDLRVDLEVSEAEGEGLAALDVRIERCRLGRHGTFELRLDPGTGRITPPKP